jgi:hypothetical protein
MNEKLKTMLMECYSHYAVNQIDHEKFAKLIIQDIVKIIENPVNYNTCVYTTHDSGLGACVAHEIVSKIKEHFKDPQ